MGPDRAATILARFNAVHATLVHRLRDLPPEAAEHRSAGKGWSPAQIGCHVAMTNEWLARILAGETSLARPTPEGFVESFDARAIPAKLKTSPQLEPPAIVSGAAALERLRASGHQVSKAIASLNADRGAGYCVTMSFGTLSLFELAEFAVAHVSRHIGQLPRVAGA
jgi:hypothetical protein